MSTIVKPQTPQILIKEIQDVYTRKNFQALSDFFAAQNQLLNFKFVEINISKAVTNGMFPHGLSKVPKDFVISRVTGPGQFTLNYGLFDQTNINYTTTDACRVRGFVGTYWGDTSTIQNNLSDVQVLNTPATPSSDLGKIITSSPTNPVPIASTGTYVTVTTITVPPGKWMVFGMLALNNVTGISGVTAGEGAWIQISSVSSTGSIQPVGVSPQVQVPWPSTPNPHGWYPFLPPFVSTFKSTTTLGLLGRLYYTASSSNTWTTASFITAIKVGD